MCVQVSHVIRGFTSPLPHFLIPSLFCRMLHKFMHFFSIPPNKNQFLYKYWAYCDIECQYSNKKAGDLWAACFAMCVSGVLLWI